MKSDRLQRRRQSVKERPSKLIYNPAKQFKHRDLRSIAEGIVALNREELILGKSCVEDK